MKKLNGNVINVVKNSLLNEVVKFISDHKASTKSNLRTHIKHHHNGDVR